MDFIRVALVAMAVPVVVGMGGLLIWALAKAIKEKLKDD